MQELAKLAAYDRTTQPKLEGVSLDSLQRVREQARIQVEGRREGRPMYELLSPVRQGEGLAALPPPSPGDLFFDLEGDPYALRDGIEYLFGYVDAAGEYTLTVTGLNGCTDSETVTVFKFEDGTEHFWQHDVSVDDVEFPDIFVVIGNPEREWWGE